MTPYDNALAESIIGLYKTELIRRREPWKQLDDVEYATLEWRLDESVDGPLSFWTLCDEVVGG